MRDLSPLDNTIAYFEFNSVTFPSIAWWEMRTEPALGERITWGKAKIAGEHLLCGPGRAEPPAQCASLLSLLSQGTGAGPALKGLFDRGDKGAAAGPVPLSARGRQTRGPGHPQSRGKGLPLPRIF